MYAEVKLIQLQQILEEYESKMKELKIRNEELEKKIKELEKEKRRKSDCVTANTSLSDIDI